MDREFLPDQLVEVRAGHQHISAGSFGRNGCPAQFHGDFSEDFGRKKSDLTFKIDAVIEESVSANSLARHAFCSRHLPDRVRSDGLAVAAHKIVTTRKKQS